jgi:predicted DNA-binding transcriptional regulator AlpA
VKPRPQPVITGERLLSIQAVMAKCDISRTTLTELVKEGRFPQPRKVPGHDGLKRWRGSDVDAWIRELPMDKGPMDLQQTA